MTAEALAGIKLLGSWYQLSSHYSTQEKMTNGETGFKAASRGGRTEEFGCESWQPRKGHFEQSQPFGCAFSGKISGSVRTAGSAWPRSGQLWDKGD